MQDKDIYTLKEAAQYLDISYSTAKRLVQKGALPVFRVGRQWRVRKDELDRFSRKSSMPLIDLPPTPQNIPLAILGAGLSTTGSYQIYFKLQVLNRYRNNSRYVLEEDETSGRFALKEEFYKTTGHIGVFWAKVREIKFRKAALANGVTVVCLDSEYYARNVGGIVYEYKHWHNYRIHYSNPL